MPQTAEYPNLLKMEGEKQEGWELRFTTNVPLSLPEGTVAINAMIGRGDGKYYDLTFLRADNSLNQMGYGAGAVIERAQGAEVVGVAITVLSQNQSGEVLISTVTVPGRKRLGRGIDTYLEGHRASADNLKALPSIGEPKMGKPGFSNDARITGDAPTGAPIDLGVAIMTEPAESLNWMTLEEFALEGDDLITLGSAFRAIGLLGMLKEARLPKLE